MTIEKPNYTQIPNALLGDLLAGDVVAPGLMSQLENSHVKVFLAVCRLTFGYHRAERRASLTMIEQFTGLSRQGVVNAAKALERANLIEREQDGGLTLWRVKVSSQAAYQSTELTRPVNSVDHYQSTQLTAPVNSVDQTSQLSRPPSKKETRKKPRKKNLEKNEKNGGGGGGVFNQEFTRLVSIYENEFGRVTPNLSLLLADDLKVYGLAKIQEAIELAITNEKRMWSYVRGILKRAVESSGAADEGPLPISPELPELPAPKSEIERQWDMAKSQLRLQMTQATFDSQIARCQLTRENGHYVILAPTSQNVEILENRLRGEIERTLVRVTNDPAPVVVFGVAS